MSSTAHPRPWNLPAGARLVIAFEFCERVGFYAMVSLLALFLSADRSTGGFGWDRDSALTVLGVYSGLMYALPVLGGWVADRLLGHRRALTVGGTLMLGGYVLLTIAVLMARVNPASAPLGFWHTPAQLSAEAAHQYGLVTVGFWVSISALAAYLALGRRHLKPREASRALTPEPPGLTSSLEAGSGVRLFILAVFALLLLVYSIGSFQLWGTMSLFLERDVNRHVGLFDIPTQWFTSIESAGLIIAAPTFAALWAWLARRDAEPDILIKYVLALSLGAAGLLLFAAAAWPHSTGTKPGWVLPGLGIAIQAMGEVAAWTVSYGLVYRLAP